MTETITPDENEGTLAQVVEIKPKGKPGPKPKPEPVPVLPVGVPFQGGIHPELARGVWEDNAKSWTRLNNERKASNAYGIDGYLLELTYRAMSTGLAVDLNLLSQAAAEAAVRAVGE